METAQVIAAVVEHEQKTTVGDTLPLHRSIHHLVALAVAWTGLVQTLLRATSEVALGGQTLCVLPRHRIYK